MEPEEAEYECSESYADVGADAHVCPNCGASLDDPPAEVKLEYIPIGSDPAEIAAIESLLIENNIEYSIHQDSLSSMFGMSTGQATTLLIRMDQVERVTEILRHVEQGSPTSVYESMKKLFWFFMR